MFVYVEFNLATVTKIKVIKTVSSCNKNKSGIKNDLFQNTKIYKLYRLSYK